MFRCTTLRVSRYIYLFCHYMTMLYYRSFLGSQKAALGEEARYSLVEGPERAELLAAEGQAISLVARMRPLHCSRRSTISTIAQSSPEAGSIGFGDDVLDCLKAKCVGLTHTWPGPGRRTHTASSSKMVTCCSVVSLVSKSVHAIEVNPVLRLSGWKPVVQTTSTPSSLEASMACLVKLSWGAMCLRWMVSCTILWACALLTSLGVMEPCARSERLRTSSSINGVVHPSRWRCEDCRGALAVVSTMVPVSISTLSCAPALMMVTAASRK